MAGTIFVFGELPARVKRVRVTGQGGRRERRPAARTEPLASFYAVALSSDACEVRVRDADRRGDAAQLGSTGPAVEGSRADRRRCRPRESRRPMRVPVGATGAGPYALAAGPDDALWVTLVHSGEIARVGVDGSVDVIRSTLPARDRR